MFQQSAGLLVSPEAVINLVLDAFQPLAADAEEPRRRVQYLGGQRGEQLGRGLQVIQLDLRQQARNLRGLDAMILEGLQKPSRDIAHRVVSALSEQLAQGFLGRVEKTGHWLL